MAEGVELALGTMMFYGLADCHSALLQRRSHLLL